LNGCLLELEPLVEKRDFFELGVDKTGVSVALVPVPSELVQEQIGWESGLLRGCALCTKVKQCDLATRQVNI